MSGDISLATLYISIASACILLWCIETELQLGKVVLGIVKTSSRTIVAQENCPQSKN